MFRKLLLSTAFLYAFVATNAQPVFIDSVENNNIGRPSRIGDGNEMFTYYIHGADNTKQKNASLVLNLTTAGQEPRRVRYDIDKNVNILSAAASNMGAVFLTYNTATKASTLMLLDFAGNITQKIPVEGITQEQAVWDNDIRLFAAMPEGYVLVLPNAKKNSYVVVAYSSELKELWKERYEAKGNTVEVADAKMIGESLFVLRREQMDAKQQKYAYHLQVVDLLQHTAKMHELKDKNDNYCFATAMNEQEGVVQIAGLCYKDGKFVPGLPAGIAVYEFEMSGMPVRDVFINGQEVGKFLPDQIIAAMATNSVLTITAVLNNIGQNVYHLVGEMMEKKETDNKKQEAKINISDLMTMVVSKEGELQKLTLADKAPHMAISLKGSPVTADINTTATWLLKNRLYNTKAAVQVGDGYYVCTKSTDSTKNDIEAVFISMDDPTLNSQFTMSLSRTPSNDIGMKPTSKYTVVAGTPDMKIKRWQKTDVFNIRGIQFVFFNQVDNRMILYYDDVVKRNSK